MELNKLEAYAKHGDMGPYSAQIAELIAIIRRQERELAHCGAPRWVSIEEEMPNEGETVAALIYPYNNHENKRIVTHGILWDGTFVNHEGDDLHPPTHWMRIPSIESAAVEGEEGANP